MGAKLPGSLQVRSFVATLSSFSHSHIDALLFRRDSKVIGGVFLAQHRYLRADPESPGKGKCLDKTGDEYDQCLEENRLCGSDKFYSFYPVCHIDWDPLSAEQQGMVPLPYGPYLQTEAESARFTESVVTQAALGEGTTEAQMCTQLATDNDGQFCISCLKQQRVPGAAPFMVYDDTPGTDCFKCKVQCLKIVAPVSTPTDIGVLTPGQICGMCTFADTASPTSGYSDKIDPAGHYARGFVTPAGVLNPKTMYGWAKSYDNGTSQAEFSVCREEKAQCLASACDRCILKPEVDQAHQAEKEEKPCSALFSGGPVTDPDGARYDCGVRLVAGARGAGSSLSGDGVNSGRVEVKHNGVWGTICGTSWDDQDADMLCRSIGFAGGVALTRAHPDACVLKTVTETDPVPGPDVATAASLGVTIDPESTQCMYCNNADRVPCHVKVVATTAAFGSEASWKILDSAGKELYTNDFVADNAADTVARSLPIGELTIRALDREADGWHPEWQEVVLDHASLPSKNNCPNAFNGVCEAAAGFTGPDGCPSGQDTEDCAAYCESFWAQTMGVCRVCLSGTTGDDGAPCPGGGCEYEHCATSCDYAEVDTCGYQNDNYCDVDGGWCPPGSDFDDCGVPKPPSLPEFCLGRVTYPDGAGRPVFEAQTEFDTWDPDVGLIQIFELSGAACDTSTAATAEATCTQRLVKEEHIGVHRGFFDPVHEEWLQDVTYQCGNVGNPTPGDCAYADCLESSYETTVCDAPFGRGTGKIWLGGLDCSGSESSLCECRQDPEFWQWTEDGAPISWGAGEWLQGCGDHSSDGKSLHTVASGRRISC